ncbi:hypothetical protein NHQ30_011097 [Ciborinia camelliae]|nr:hypothetical protein NHQ30_011097 [Ciborinia camelliae]
MYHAMWTKMRECERRLSRSLTGSNPGSIKKKFLKCSDGPCPLDHTKLPADIWLMILKELAYEPHTFMLYRPRPGFIRTSLQRLPYINFRFAKYDLRRYGFGCNSSNDILKVSQVNRAWRDEIQKLRPRSFQVAGSASRVFIDFDIDTVIVPASILNSHIEITNLNKIQRLCVIIPYENAFVHSENIVKRLSQLSLHKNTLIVAIDQSFERLSVPGKLKGDVETYQTDEYNLTVARNLERHLNQTSIAKVNITKLKRNNIKYHRRVENWLEKHATVSLLTLLILAYVAGIALLVSKLGVTLPGRTNGTETSAASSDEKSRAMTATP